MTMNDMQYLEEKEEFIYTVNTYSYENTEKPILQVHIPKELEYEKVTNRGKFENGEVSEKEIESSRISYDKNTGILKININENKQNLETLNIYLKVKQTEEKVYTKEITLKSSITATNVETEYSNTLKATIIKNALKITQTSNIPEGSNIENNEEYQYKLLIESKGEKTGKSIYIDLIDNLPEEVTFVKAIQKGQDGKEEQLAGYVQDDNSVKMSTSVNEGETKEVTIYVKAKTQDTDTKITNKIEAYINENEKIEVNTISHTIKAIDIDNIKPDDQITKKLADKYG